MILALVGSGAFVLVPHQAQAACTTSGNTITCNGTTTTTDAPIAQVTDGGSITNNGTATATSSPSTPTSISFAIFGNNHNVLTNNGSLSTNGDSADALEVLGDQNTLLNKGSVSTTGPSANAIRAVGNQNILTNTGQIHTGTGGSAFGMFANGTGNTLTNSGTITTEGFGSEAMSVDGNGNTEINNSSIVTSGDTGNGIRAHGSNNNVLNAGTITTSGPDGRGIKIDAGTNNTVDNRGSISTAGTSAYGIWVASTAGQTTSILNESTGVISAQGDRALFFADGNESVVNFGRISTSLAGAGIAAANLGAGNDSFLIGSTSQITGFIDAGPGTDTFALGGNTDATFKDTDIGPASEYRNFENYEKVGTSTWTVTGTNDSSMPWTIRQGTLMVVGSMGGSDMTVLSNGTLGGTGTVGSITTVSGATLTPGVNGIGSMTVNGNVLIANGTLYNIDLTPDLRSDRIDAKGTATIQGGTVNVAALPGDYKPGSRWTILTAAGGVNGQFAGVQTNLAFFKPILTKDGNDVYLQLPFALPSSFPQDRPVIEPYLPLAEVDLPNALRQTSGEANVSATDVIVSNDELFRGAILCRLRCSTGGLPAFATLNGASADYMADYPAHKGHAAPPAPPAPADRDWALWGKVVGSWGSTDATARTASVDRSSAGIVLGADMGLGSPYRLGLAAGYFSTSFDVGTLASSGTVESAYVGAYGAAAFNNFTFRGGVAYGHHDVDVARTIIFPGFSGATRSSSDTSSLQAFGELGYTLALNNRFAFEPFVGLAHVYIGDRSIVEEGSAIGVTGQVDSFESTFSTLGTRIIATIPTSVGELTFKGLVGWRHAFGDTLPEATFSYVSGSTPFLIDGAPIDKNSFVAEAGLNWAVNDKVTLGVMYDGAIGPRDQEHTVRGSLSVKF